MNEAEATDSRWLVSLVPPVDRALSGGVAVTTFLLAFLLALRDVLPPFEFRDYAWWWVSFSAVTLSWGVINAAFWRTMRLSTLRRWWILVPTIGMVRMLTIGWAVDVAGGDTFQLESWIGGSTYLVYLIFVLKPIALMTVVLASALLPAVSFMMAIGYVPASVWHMIPVYASYVLLVANFLGVRQILVRLHAVTETAHVQQHRAAIAQAAARSRARYARLVHDEVLASLSGAMLVHGEPSHEVRQQASQALAVLDSGFDTGFSSGLEGRRSTRKDVPGSGFESCAAVRAALLHLAGECEEPFTVDVHAGEGMIPTDVATVLISASREAIRNSVRHAGSGAHRTLRAHVAADHARVEIADDGPGFVREQVSGDRLGVSHSIVAALEHLEGGQATIQTVGGTRVVLTWRR